MKTKIQTESDATDKNKRTINEPGFDREKIATREVQRRLLLLGDLTREETFDYKKFKARATEVGVLVSILKQNWTAYKAFGPDGLKPDLRCLKPEEYPDILNRLEYLRPEVDYETFSSEDIRAIAERSGWSESTVYRWARRYRAGGEAALGKDCNPLKSSKRSHKKVEDLGGLDDTELEGVFEKLEWLGPLIHLDRLTDTVLEKRVAELQEKGIDKSKWTLRHYWTRCKKLGKGSLRRKSRADKGQSHKLEADVKRAVQVLHLIYPALPATRIQQEVAKWAAVRGLEPPSVPQVRRICSGVSEALKLIAAGRYGEFRNKFKITHSIDFGFKVVFQIDHTQVPVWVRDVRDPRYRSKSGKVAPYLITVVEARSRRILAWLFTYDRPDRFDVALVIRKAILAGGIPNEIWPDFGPELIAEHIKGITRALDILLDPHGPDKPQQKGRVERPYQRFTSQLWARHRSYYGHLDERDARKVPATETIGELDARFAAYIENDYNRTEHSSTGQTPLDYWDQNIILLSADPDLLDILMMEEHTRQVGKAGIRFMNRTYWHQDLVSVIGREVLIRSPERYFAPEEIWVFDHRERVCIAPAEDSEKGLMLSRADFAEAQRTQHKQLAAEVKEAKVFASAMKAELEEAEAEKKEKPAGKASRRKADKTGQPAKPKGKGTGSKTSRQANVLERLRDKSRKQSSDDSSQPEEDSE